MHGKEWQMILLWSQRSPQTKNSFTVLSYVPSTENMGPNFLVVKNAIAAYDPPLWILTDFFFFYPEVVPFCQILFYQV